MLIADIYEELSMDPGMFNKALTIRFLEAAFALMYERSSSEIHWFEKKEQQLKARLVTPPLYPGCLFMLLTGQFVQSSSSFVDRLAELNGPEIRFSQLCKFLGIDVVVDPSTDHELMCASAVFEHIGKAYDFS